MRSHTGFPQNRQSCRENAHGLIFAWRCAASVPILPVCPDGGTMVQADCGRFFRVVTSLQRRDRSRTSNSSKRRICGWREIRRSACVRTSYSGSTQPIIRRTVGSPVCLVVNCDRQPAQIVPRLERAARSKIDRIAPLRALPRCEVLFLGVGFHVRRRSSIL